MRKSLPLALACVPVALTCVCLHAALAVDAPKKRAITLDDLAKFRRTDGALPRVVLLSAGAAVRMNVAPPPAQ